MGRHPFRVHAVALVLVAVSTFGCGGGAGSFVAPPAPDFLLAVSPGAVSVAQGSSSSAVNVMVTAENGFSGSVQVTLTGIPAGVTANPASPFTVAAGAQTSIIFGASTSVAIGDVAISAQGISGTLSHSAPLTLDIMASTAPAVPRTS